MIEAVILYAIFCATTAATCTLSFWNPVVQEAVETETNNTLVQRKLASTFIYFCLTFVFAPAMFIILFSKSMSESYIKGLKRVLKEED